MREAMRFFVHALPTRRLAPGAIVGFVAFVLAAVPLRAEVFEPFEPERFAAAQAAGKPIVIDVFATWCSTCKVQEPIQSALAERPEFDDFVLLRVNYDEDKETVRRFAVPKQSTILVFKGEREMARSTGETDPDALEALWRQAL